MKLLIYNLQKMVNGSKNLDLMLKGQRPYLDKTGLGYVEKYDEESVRILSKQPKVCHLYFKYGHPF